MNRKSDNLPGSMTLWRGYENLKESIVMLQVITLILFTESSYEISELFFT